MDKVDNLRNSGILCDLDAILPNLRLCRAIARLFPRIPGDSSPYLRKSSILGNNSRNTSNVSHTGLCMEIVSPSSLLSNISARRMYYPKQYHYVQEIQKFNVADYRPRYSLQLLPSLRYITCPLVYLIELLLYNLFLVLHALLPKLHDLISGWSNSKKQFAKSVKYKECENNAATPSLKATKVKCVLFAHTILLNIVASTAK